MNSFNFSLTFLFQYLIIHLARLLRFSTELYNKHWSKSRKQLKQEAEIRNTQGKIKRYRGAQNVENTQTLQKMQLRSSGRNRTSNYSFRWKPENLPHPNINTNFFRKAEE